MANEISRLTKLNEMAQAKIDAAHIAAQDQATAIGELTSKIGELQTLLEAAMSTVKGLPERALRDKQAHSRLLAVVGQYDLFAAKQKRKVRLEALFESGLYIDRYLSLFLLECVGVDA